MQSFFTASFFTANRNNLRGNIATDALVVITANGVLQRTSDTTFPFAQDRNFWYLTGVDEPDVVLVMDGKEDYLILPRSNAVRDVFDGVIDTAVLIKRSGVQTILDYNNGWARLTASLTKSGEVHTLRPPSIYEPHHAMYVNPARRRLLEKIKRQHPKLKVQDIRRELAELRVIKQPAEQAALREAVDITTRTIDFVRKQSVLKTMAYEYELEAAITYEFRKRGASGHAYTPIVASGEHATTLHYVENNGSLGAGELVVVDVGAEVEHYAADITRTLCKQPLTARQKSIVAAVKDVQGYALTLLKPGLLLKDYEQQVAVMMGKTLKTLHLIDDATDHNAIRHYYPHATSHFLGLDVHDVGSYGTPLAPGMAMTCEPGMYIPEEGIGVRLEDDVLITEKGCENLSQNCSYDPYIV